MININMPPPSKVPRAPAGPEAPRGWSGLDAGDGQVVEAATRSANYLGQIWAATSSTTHDRGQPLNFRSASARHPAGTTASWASASARAFVVHPPRRRDALRCPQAGIRGDTCSSPNPGRHLTDVSRRFSRSYRRRRRRRTNKVRPDSSGERACREARSAIGLCDILGVVYACATPGSANCMVRHSYCQVEFLDLSND